MLKKFVLTAALLAGSLPVAAVSQPTPAPLSASRSTVQGFNECLTGYGCWYIEGSGWQCLDPEIMVICKVPDSRR